MLSEHKVIAVLTMLCNSINSQEFLSAMWILCVAYMQEGGEWGEGGGGGGLKVRTRKKSSLLNHISNQHNFTFLTFVPVTLVHIDAFCVLSNDMLNISIGTFF